MCGIKNLTSVNDAVYPGITVTQRDQQQAKVSFGAGKISFWSRKIGIWGQEKPHFGAEKSTLGAVKMTFGVREKNQ